ncbi:MAG: PilZ domain-containing protein [Polyangiaceae bacterium]|nr:PilZ domain-containing protein [Polyangiaceae bacterium]
MDRREHERLRAWIPVTVQGERGGIAVTHDASRGGLLLVTAERLADGQEVAIELRAPDGGPETLHLRGRVVRSEANPRDPDGLWRWQAAIQFEGDVPAIEALLHRLESGPASQPPSRR